jgi:phosphatidylserine/phosphatidylglycerophosphate/cardiolipin synthase-like enzyme
VDLTTLAVCSPTAATVADGIFHEKIVEGMKIALDRNPNVTFRFLAGAPPVVTGWLAQNYMKALQKDLGAKYFAMARIFVTSSMSSQLQSWNHAKIVAVDGKRSIVGGHNLWNADYNAAAPVTDVSMTLRGPAVSSSHRFADLLWVDICDVEEKNPFGFKMVRSPAAIAAGKVNHALVCPRQASYTNLGVPTDEDGPHGERAGVEGVSVLALGQLGVGIPPPGGYLQSPSLCGSNHGHAAYGVSCVPNIAPGIVPTTDYINDGADYSGSLEYAISNPQEEGIRALLASARESIVMAQQDVIFAGGSQSYSCAAVPHGAHYDLRLIDLLVRKMVVENVSVSLVISTPGGTGGYTNVGSMSDVTSVFVARIIAKNYSSTVKDAQALLCSRMKLGSLRISKGFKNWADGTSNRLHSKVHLVDDAAYYIGSKNSYPALLQVWYPLYLHPLHAPTTRAHFTHPLYTTQYTHYAHPLHAPTVHTDYTPISRTHYTHHTHYLCATTGVRLRGAGFCVGR